MYVAAPASYRTGKAMSSTATSRCAASDMRTSIMPSYSILPRTSSVMPSATLRAAHSARPGEAAVIESPSPRNASVRPSTDTSSDRGAARIGSDVSAKPVISGVKKLSIEAGSPEAPSVTRRPSRDSVRPSTSIGTNGGTMSSGSSPALESSHASRVMRSGSSSPPFRARAAAHPERHAHGLAAAPRARHRDRSLHRPRALIGRDAHAQPERLHGLPAGTSTSFSKARPFSSTPPQS